MVLGGTVPKNAPVWRYFGPKVGGFGGPGAQKPLLNPFLDIVDLCDYKIGDTWIFGG